MNDALATIGRGDAEHFMVIDGSRGWRGLKDDLLPIMALLGVVYGWAFALLVAVIAAVALVVR